MEHLAKIEKEVIAEEPKPCTSGIKRKSNEPEASTSKAGPPPKKKGLWIAADISESDLEDSSDED